MAALSAARNTPKSLGHVRDIPLAAGARVYAGGMVQVAASNYGVAAGAVAANVTIGRAEDTFDNTGGINGAVTARVRRGIFRYANSASGDLITRSMIGKPCYVVDDQTVAATSNSNARPQAGIVFDVDTVGVWVQFN